MTDQAPKSAAEEFVELRKEVALQRRAIERLLNERGITPDYTETLGKMMRDLKDASKNLTWLVNRPSMQATPEALANQIVIAGDQARKQDRESIMEAARTLTLATENIKEHVAKGREARLQRQWLWRGCLSAAGAGALMGIVLTIGIFHLIPERGAAWILGLDRWEAGQRLMKSANS